MHVYLLFSSPLLIMAASIAHYVAVRRLSPESIMTFTPPTFNFSMLSLTPSLKGSYNPKTATNMNSLSIFVLSLSVAKLL